MNDLVNEAVEQVQGTDIEPTAAFIIFRQTGAYDTTVEVVADKQKRTLLFHVHALCGLPGLEKHIQNCVTRRSCFHSNMIYERGDDYLGNSMAYYVHLRLPPLLSRKRAFEEAQNVGLELLQGLQRFYLESKSIAPPAE